MSWCFAWHNVHAKFIIIKKKKAGSMMIRTCLFKIWVVSQD
ncbi:hypothetical protein HMPREF0645_2226 [Hallella bergensis DSM 17361]|uniref:Uncharacterized protein n=1 Tax=Hallella bergensis DSM 17361 TaxID=585502 RepID=D1PZ41_9BACT|nr:hypothetical protein HMPREF0645_2226 [Hallella bergensis DSM 17361]